MCSSDLVRVDQTVEATFGNRADFRHGNRQQISRQRHRLAVRLFAAELPELLITSSCSKNFVIWVSRPSGCPSMAISSQAETHRRSAVFETE